MWLYYLPESHEINLPFRQNNVLKSVRIEGGKLGYRIVLQTIEENHTGQV